MNLKDLLLGTEDRGAIVGQTGTGKSFLAKRLLPKTGRLAIIDPKRTFAYPEMIFDTAKSIWRAKPDRFIFRPKPQNLGDLHEMSEVYRYCFEKGNITVYTDDVAGIVPRMVPPHFLQVCYQMGREKKVRCLAGFQRPVSLPIFMMSEAQKVYAFKVTKKDDIKTIEEYCPGYAAAGFETRHDFYFYSAYSDMDNASRLRLEEK